MTATLFITPHQYVGIDIDRGKIEAWAAEHGVQWPTFLKEINDTDPIFLIYPTVYPHPIEATFPDAASAIAFKLRWL